MTEIIKQLGIVAAGCLIALLTEKGGEAVIHGVQKRREKNATPAPETK